MSHCAIIATAGFAEVIGNQTLVVRPTGGGAIITINFASSKESVACAKTIIAAAGKMDVNLDLVKEAAATPLTIPLVLKLLLSSTLLPTT